MAEDLRNGNTVSRIASTGATGEYFLDEVRHGTYLVRVALPPGYLPLVDRSLQVTIVVDRDSQVSSVDFALQRGLQIRGKVVDDSGAGVRSAEVFYEDHTNQAARSTIASGEGAFILDGLRYSDRIVLFAAKGDRLSPPLVCPLPRSGLQKVVLKLAASGGIQGVVVDEDGHPLPRVLVWAAPVLAPARTSVAETDAQGTFMITGLLPTSYEFRVKPEHRYFTPDKSDAEVRVPPGEVVRDVKIVIPNLGPLKISGKVTDSAGNPVVHAGVDASGPVRARAVTDEAGEYTIDGLRQGSFDLTAEHPGYTRSKRDAVVAGQTNVDFVLEGLASVSGRVLSKDGLVPVEAFQIACVPTSRNAPDPWRIGDYTDVRNPDGAFNFSELEAGSWTLVVRAPEFAPTVEELPRLAGGENRTGMEIALQRGRTVEGTVIDEGGQPIPGALLFAGGMPSQSDYTKSAVTQTNVDGVFRIDQVPQTEDTLTAFDPAYGSTSVTLRPVAWQQVTLCLKEKGAITGHVFAGEVPSAGAQVELWYTDVPGGHGQRTRTTPDGYYEFRGLPPGAALVTAQLPAGSGSSAKREKRRFAAVETHASTTVDFSFPAADGALLGTVTRDGAPVRASVKARVITADSTEEAFEASTDETGFYQFKEIPAGTVTLDVRVVSEPSSLGSDVVMPSFSFTTAVSGDQATWLDVKIPAGNTLSGNAEGLAPGEAGLIRIYRGQVDASTLLASWHPESIGQVPINEADGTFTIPELQSGIYTLLASTFQRPTPGTRINPDSRRYSTFVVEVREGLPQTVTLALP